MLRYRHILQSICLLVSTLPLAGCIIEGASTYNLSSSSTAPAIVTNPASVTVPIGLTYTFTVVASGSPLHYQWLLNGTPILGANSYAYTIPTVALTNSGNLYTVTVSNSAGTVTSQPATLTAGARAPKAGDLRFQQVDSENTINGYGIGTGFPDAGGGYTTPAFGTMYLSNGSCSSTLGCVPFHAVFAQPSGAVPLAIGFVPGYYTNLETDLSTGVSGFMGLAGGSLLAPNTVVTSLQLDPADNAYSLSYLKTSQAGGFNLAQHTVGPATLQAAATQEGLAGRVITAISDNTGQFTYFSYGWAGDTTTIYEAQVTTTTLTAVGNAATALALQGYIITAIGITTSNGVVLVGTRVQGDTLPRPMLVAPTYSVQTSSIVSQGYALVGVVNDSSSGTGTTVGER